MVVSGRGKRVAIAVAACAGLFAWRAGQPVYAQIVLDGTMGTAGALSGPNFAIGSVLGRQVGGNLFHSFSQFNVNTGQSATFSGPTSVNNVISRVTGPSFSNINGLLRSTIPNANFYLLNPKGILFGPSASLDVRGSFYASTASNLKLGSDGIFDAVNPAASNLTMSPPSAFGFLGPTSSQVYVDRSFLQVPNGKTLGLIGGDVTLSGAFLRSRGGRLQIGSAWSAAEIAIDGGGMLQAPAGSLDGFVNIFNSTLIVDTSTSGLPAGGIQIRGGTLVSVNSDFSAANNASGAAQAVSAELDGPVLVSGGTWFVDGLFGPGGNLSIKGSSITIADGAWMTTDSFGFGAGGNLSITAAGSINVADSEVFSTASFSGASGNVSLTAGGPVSLHNAILGTRAKSTGAGGNLNINGASLTVSGNSFLNTWSSSAGRAGNVAISVPGHVDLDGAWVSSSGESSGTAGNTSINAGSMRVAASSIVANSLGSGAAGAINVSVQGHVDLEDGASLNSSAFGSGTAGSVSISAGSFRMADSFIFAESLGPGAAGAVNVSLTGAAEILGSSLSSAGSSSGRAGTVSINASSLRVADSFIDVEAVGSGAAGNVNVALTGAAELLGSGISALAGTGTGGSVVFSAGSLQMDQAFISVGSLANSPSVANISISGALEMVNSARISGSGADLSISAGSLSLAGASDISTRGFGPNASHPAVAGNILLTVPTIALDGGSTVITSVVAGEGGALTVRTQDLALANGSFLVTSASTGRGGPISVESTGSVRLSGVSHISAGANNTGTAGSIFVDTPLLTMAGDSEIAGRTSGSGTGASIAIRADSILLNKSNIGADSVGTGDAGSIDIRADRLELTDGAIISTLTSGGGQAGSIAINAGSIEFRGQTATSFSGITSSSVGSGKGGDVTIVANDMALLQGGAIQNSAFGSGVAGTVSLNIAGTLRLDGVGQSLPSEISSSSFGAGNAGDIVIDAGRIVATGGGLIAAESFSTGHGGRISILAGEIEFRGLSGSWSSGISASTSAAGSGGAVTVVANDLTILEGGGILASSSGSGNAGSVNLNVAGTLRLDGTGNGLQSAVTTTTNGAGNAGDIGIDAGRLVVSGGAIISASSNSTGDGGRVSIRAGDIELAGRDAAGNGSAIRARATSSGDGGSIDASAATIALRDGAVITAESTSTGRAGSISLFASDQLTLGGGSAITTKALQSDGGDIHIQAKNLIYLSNSEISTSVGSGAGNGGNIFIDPIFVVLDHSQIIANAFGGNGGNITIIADNFLSQASLVQASSELGISGNVEISVPKTDVNSALSTLSSAFFDASSLISQSCATRAASAGSSLIGAGRGGLATAPEDMGAGAHSVVLVSPADRAPLAGMPLAAANIRIPSTGPCAN